MMTSLLSIFDPSSPLMMNWWFMLITPIFPFMNKIFFHNFFSLSMNKILNLTSKVFLSSKKTNLVFVSLFLIILSSNILGLTPYTFSTSSHFTYNLSLSLFLWLASMIWGFIFHTKSNFAHLTPMGCPLILVPFMVLIELISSIIRPLTLSLRLMANMLAGHLILVLMSSFLNFSYVLPSSILFTILTGWMMFEFGVCLVQSYIFSYLMFLYWEENK